jgi:hypothetical protein
VPQSPPSHLKSHCGGLQPLKNTFFENSFNPPEKSKAIVLLHSVTKCWPNKTQSIEINAKVSNAYLQRWEEVLKEWMMRGYSPKNVSGMLQWFEKGIPDWKKQLTITTIPVLPLKNFKENERGTQAFQGVPVRTYKTGER